MGLYQASLPDESRWAGPISISFLGSVDSARSDDLLAGNQPAWNPTLGFSKSDSGASGDDDKPNGASQVACTYTLTSPWSGVYGYLACIYDNFHTCRANHRYY